MVVNGQTVGLAISGDTQRAALYLPFFRRRLEKLTKPGLSKVLRPEPGITGICKRIGEAYKLIIQVAEPWAHWLDIVPDPAQPYGYAVQMMAVPLPQAAIDESPWIKTKELGPPIPWPGTDEAYNGQVVKIGHRMFMMFARNNNEFGGLWYSRVYEFPHRYSAMDGEVILELPDRALLLRVFEDKLITVVADPDDNPSDWFMAGRTLLRTYDLDGALTAEVPCQTFPFPDSHPDSPPQVSIERGNHEDLFCSARYFHNSYTPGVESQHTVVLTRRALTAPSVPLAEWTFELDVATGSGRLPRGQYDISGRMYEWEDWLFYIHGKAYADPASAGVLYHNDVYVFDAATGTTVTVLRNTDISDLMFVPRTSRVYARYRKSVIPDPDTNSVAELVIYNELTMALNNDIPEFEFKRECYRFTHRWIDTQSLSVMERAAGLIRTYPN